MPSIRRCRNENCECNVDGSYCDAIEVELNEDGVCETAAYMSEAVMESLYERKPYESMFVKPGVPTYKITLVP
jgi:hypothetical protein